MSSRNNSKPRVGKPDPIVTPRDIAERMRRAELARRTDEILKHSGLKPVSAVAGTPIRGALRPLRSSFNESWRRPLQPQPRRVVTAGVAPTRAEPAQRDDDLPLMDRRWSDR